MYVTVYIYIPQPFGPLPWELRANIIWYGQAVSVSLPTWSANVGYEEGEEWVMSRMTTGYPRYVSFTNFLQGNNEQITISLPC